MDDERAYQNALLATYPETKISLCLFHVNKNILKRMAKKKLSNFFRKTQKDEEKWTFGKMKELMALPFLKEDMIVDEFRAIKTSVYASRVHECHGDQRIRGVLRFNRKLLLRKHRQDSNVVEVQTNN